MNRKRALATLLSLGIVTLTACGGKSANSYYKDGNERIEKGEYAEAITELEQAIKKNPERAEYYIANGFAHIGDEKYEEALNQFDKALSEKDNQVVRENNKALFRGKGIAFLRLGKYAEALKEFQKAMEIKASQELDIDIKKYMALSELKLGNYQAAATIYEEVLKSEKPDTELYSRLASAYTALGRVEEAINKYESAIAVDKDNFEAYFGLYDLYVENGREDDAKATLERAAGIKVTDDVSGYHSGVLEYLRGNYEKATLAFEVAYDKKIHEASYYLGRISIMKKDYAAARNFFERYEKEVGKVSLSGWYDGLAECEMEGKNYEKALGLVNKGLTMEDVSFMRNLLLKKITVLEKMNDYNTAYETSGEYLKLYPEDEAIKKENKFLETRVIKPKEKKKGKKKGA